MKKNMGAADKIIRIIVALAIVALYYTGRITGTTAIVMLAFSAIFVLTSLVGTCPLYLPFGINTGKKEK